MNNNNDVTKKYMPDIGAITKDTVEAELEKLKLIEDDYQSDDDNDRVFRNNVIFIRYQLIN